MFLNAVIIEDEPSASQVLKGMLENYCPNIKIKGIARNIEEALISIRKFTPDLIFLDIELSPIGKGIDILKMLPERDFGVIITTAYPKYAIQAINDIQPWAYIVKPFGIAELIKAVLVANQKSVEKRNALKNAQSDELNGLIISDSRKGNIVIKADDILYCKADKGTVDIYLSKEGKVEKITATKSLKKLESQLPDLFFCRTHHGYLVNLKHIIRYQKTGRNGLIFMPHGHRVEISVLRMEKFERQFKALIAH